MPEHERRVRTAVAATNTEPLAAAGRLAPTAPLPVRAGAARHDAGYCARRRAGARNARGAHAVPRWDSRGARRGRPRFTKAPRALHQGRGRGGPIRAAHAAAVPTCAGVRPRQGRGEGCATHAWRRLHVPRALAELGSFENPDHRPLDGAPRRGEWTWRRSAVAEVKTVRGRIAQNAGTSSIHRDVLADDGGVTTVSRTGRLDMAGLAREHALDPVLMFQASMLEDVLQTVRAASQREKRLVRAHTIFDLDGLSVIATLARARSRPAGGGRRARYFPEVNSSTTVINCRAASRRSGASSRSGSTRRCGRGVLPRPPFRRALRDHARLDDAAVKRLPEALGGEASNDLPMPCPPFSNTIAPTSRRAASPSSCTRCRSKQHLCK